jgi:hypothetical protein
MGLVDLIRRWTKGETARSLERADEESRMTPHERDVDRESLENRQADVVARSQWTGAEASDAAEDDLRGE